MGNCICFLLINQSTLPSFLVSWWFILLVVAILCITLYLIHQSKIKALENQIGDFQRKLLERSELLTYTKLNEKKAREEAALATRNKSVLVSKISHDIRTPMNAVMGMASLLIETPLTPEQLEYTSAILDSGESLISITNNILMTDILEYSKRDSTQDLELKDFDLRNTIEEVLEVFAVKASANGVDLLYDLDDRVPIHLVGDTLRLRQILMNLVENAIRFTFTGEIIIQVSLSDTTYDNRLNLDFKVTDTGSGLSTFKAELLAKDLSPLNSATEQDSAAGFGLLICKKIIGLMGGSIKLEQTSHSGTTFKFNIWLTTNPQLSRVTRYAEMAGIENKKILLVDNNPTVLALLSKQFKKWDLLAATAQSGKQALEILSQVDKFNLVITDYDMPEMDGIELAQQIKKMHPQLAIIMLNAYNNDSYTKFPGLFQSVLNKPIRQHTLSEQILLGLQHKNANNSDNENKQKLSVEFGKQYPLNILVAEDDVMNQKLVTRVLNKLGYDPHICSNGQEVLEEVSNKNYDVILMDVQMPVMDGLEATRMIRLCLTTQPVVLAMTANTLQGDRDECMRAGMDGYISKPIKLEELVSVLEKWAVQSKQKI